jgi:hypothetical protein
VPKSAVENMRLIMEDAEIREAYDDAVASRGADGEEKMNELEPETASQHESRYWRCR